MEPDLEDKDPQWLGKLDLTESLNCSLILCVKEIELSIACTANLAPVVCVIAVC